MHFARKFIPLFFWIILLGPLNAQDEERSLKCRFAEEKLKSYFAGYQDSDYPAMNFLNSTYRYCLTPSTDMELIYRYFQVRELAFRSSYRYVEDDPRYVVQYKKMDSLIQIMREAIPYDYDFARRFGQKFDQLHRPYLAMGNLFRSEKKDSQTNYGNEGPVSDHLESVHGEAVSERLERPQKKRGPYTPKPESISEFDIPSFPVPPLDFSAKFELPDRWFSGSDRLLEVEEKIYEALRENRYNGHLRHFGVREGFVIVSSPEYIRRNKKKQPEFRRWRAEPEKYTQRAFNLFPYFQSIERSEAGLYRMFAFIVSKNAFPYRPQKMTREEAEAWYRSSRYSMLPDPISQIKFSNDYHIHVLVFEVKHYGENRPVRLEKISQKDARRHFELSGIERAFRN